MTDPERYSFEAFISYRHIGRDRAWARWLHSALESYRVPAALVRGKGLRPRLGRVFRDEEELSASSSLSAEIEQALQASRYLIVVCSRDTPGSRWVNEEIVRFRQLGRHERIRALLVDGEPDQSFPAALYQLLTDAAGVGAGRRSRWRPTSGRKTVTAPASRSAWRSSASPRPCWAAASTTFGSATASARCAGFG